MNAHDNSTEGARKSADYLVFLKKLSNQELVSQINDIVGDRVAGNEIDERWLTAILVIVCDRIDH